MIHEIPFTLEFELEFQLNIVVFVVKKEKDCTRTRREHGRNNGIDMNLPDLLQSEIIMISIAI